MQISIKKRNAAYSRNKKNLMKIKLNNLTFRKSCYSNKIEHITNNSTCKNKSKRNMIWFNLHYIKILENIF